MIRILGPQQKVPKQIKKFLANGKNKDALVEFFFQHLPHIEGLPMLFGVVELFVTHCEQCHKVANFTNDKIQIDECPELRARLIIWQKRHMPLAPCFSLKKLYK